MPEPPEQSQQSDEARLLQEFLSNRDLPCPVCGYNMRGLESNKCPECGATLDLRVGSTDLKLGLWITSVLGVALPMGFAAVTAFIFFWLGLDYGFESDLANILILFVFAAALYAIVLGLLIRKRRGFWQLSRYEQVGLALLIFVIGWLAVALLVAAIFNL